MKIKDAADILAEMAEEYGDCNLSVFADGVHHTTKLLFYAIQPMSELQKTRHATARKWDRDAVTEATVKEIKAPLKEDEGAKLRLAKLQFLKAEVKAEEVRQGLKDVW